MKLLIQRVLNARIQINEHNIAQINEGLLVFIGFGRQDSSELIPEAVYKLINLRIFSDEKGHFQYSALDQNKSILVVPQFTLYANTDSGRRPDFISAMPPQNAEKMFAQFCQFLAQQNIYKAAFGEFGADMQVSLTNDGPVTIMINV